MASMENDQAATFALPQVDCPPLERRWWHPIWYRFGMQVTLAWFYGPCRGRVHGEEHIHSLFNEGFIVAANHVSYFDWMVLYALFFHRYNDRLIFLAKDSLFRHPLWAPIMTEGNCVRVSNDGTSILDRTGYRKLRNARFVAVFPEGTRSATGNIGQAHNGATKLAALLGKPILPMTLNGFYEAWPRHRSIPRPASCHIKISGPVYVPRVCAHDNDLATEYTQQIMQRIAFALT
jgi:1-acyl-sn-glycerol-3-phosphate acyltransferase